MNQYPGITSKGVIGMFYKALATNIGAAWLPLIGMDFSSSQAIETYKWLGMVPGMREWIGGRQAKGLRENGFTVTNKLFEATLEVNKDDLNRDKTGQLQVRINELARRANSHWASLISTLIINGTGSTSGECYDGQHFFDTDHSEGSSGEQSNDLYIDISGLGCSAHGTTTRPSIEEMQQCIIQAIAAIVGFKDDQGEPMNEDAAQFLVMTPVSMWDIALAATALPNIAANVNNVIQSTDFGIKVVPNVRLSSWTDGFAVFRTDGDVKAFVKQEEIPITMAAKAEGSEFEFDTNKHQYGISASRNAAYGYWQEACYVQMY